MRAGWIAHAAFIAAFIEKLKDSTTSRSDLKTFSLFYLTETPLSDKQQKRKENCFDETQSVIHPPSCETRLPELAFLTQERRAAWGQTPPQELVVNEE